VDGVVHVAERGSRRLSARSACARAELIHQLDAVMFGILKSVTTGGGGGGGGRSGGCSAATRERAQGRPCDVNCNLRPAVASAQAASPPAVVDDQDRSFFFFFFFF